MQEEIGCSISLREQRSRIFATMARIVNKHAFGISLGWFWAVPGKPAFQTGICRMCPESGILEQKNMSI